jgi:tetratricopeptide (TPR) repeat protein
MTEEFTIQCEHCGTTYIDLEEVCPYCGQPHSSSPGYNERLPHQAAYAEPPPETTLPPHQTDFFPEENPLQPPQETPLGEEYSEDEYLPDEQFPLIEDPYLPNESFDPAEHEYLPDEHQEPVEDDYFFDERFSLAEDEYLPEEHFTPIEQGYGAGEYLIDEEIIPPREHDRLGPVDEYDEPYEPFDDIYDDYPPLDEYDEFEAQEQPRRFSKRRLLVGCLGLILCAGLFYGGIAMLGAYRGLQERVELTQVEAEDHYQKGQEHLNDGSLELAIAEFERALNLNPNFLAAREALRDAQHIAQSQPTPTSETRSAAAAEIMAQAEEQMAGEAWAEAAETLAQVRSLDSDYQPQQVSDLLYTANYKLALQLLSPDTIEEAVLAFESALAERPDDVEVTIELAKALLYIEGDQARGNDDQHAVESFSQLNREDPDYLDVEARLLEAYEAYGDELLDSEEWCQAKDQYDEAMRIRTDDVLEAKAGTAGEQCDETAVARATSTPAQPEHRGTSSPNNTGDPAANFSTSAATPITATVSTQPAAAGGGTIYFSAFNPNESRWEILAVPGSGGTPRTVVIEATMPAVSTNGKWLVYRSEAIESEGFHSFDLTSGAGQRITIARQHVLPRWGGDNSQFLFAAQEPATQRWLIYQGFLDGKSDPIIIRDGRTPDWSPDNALIAYQGTDPEGNEPGIYIVPFGGGNASRVTNHQSDRMPDFSPNGSQIVYMSTRNPSAYQFARQ